MLKYLQTRHCCRHCWPTEINYTVGKPNILADLYTDLIGASLNMETRWRWLLQVQPERIKSRISRQTLVPILKDICRSSFPFTVEHTFCPRCCFESCTRFHQGWITTPCKGGKYTFRLVICDVLIWVKMMAIRQFTSGLVVDLHQCIKEHVWCMFRGCVGGGSWKGA